MSILRADPGPAGDLEAILTAVLNLRGGGDQLDPVSHGGYGQGYRDGYNEAVGHVLDAITAITGAG